MKLLKYETICGLNHMTIEFIFISTTVWLVAFTLIATSWAEYDRKKILDLQERIEKLENNEN